MRQKLRIIGFILNILGIILILICFFGKGQYIEKVLITGIFLTLIGVLLVKLARLFKRKNPSNED